MSVQNFLKTLKTAKKSLPTTTTTITQTLSKTLINSPSNTQNLSSFIDSLSPHKLQSFLSDPNVQTSDCFQIFNVVLRLQSDLSFKPDIHAHLTLICRLIKSRKFLDAEFLLQNAAFNRNYRYPFSDFANWVENYCNESRIITKLLNMLIKTYSDHHMFDMASITFDYMVKKGFERDDRTCSVLLYAMIQSSDDNVDLALDFFRRMVGSSMRVSVYSLTIVVSGLCKVGELRMGRQLVDEMATTKNGVKPNVITFNTLVDACVRRWDVVELDIVLCLMEREHVQFNDTSYKLLIEGYSGCGKVEEAEKLVLEMHNKGIDVEVYLFYTIIRGYFRLGNVSNGVSLFRKMKETKVASNADVCWCMGSVKELVKEMQNNGVELDDVMFNALVDEYRKGGMLDEVEELKCMLEMKSSSVETSLKNTMDSESEIELIDSDSEIELVVVDDEAKTMVLDDLTLKV